MRRLKRVRDVYWVKPSGKITGYSILQGYIYIPTWIIYTETVYEAIFKMTVSTRRFLTKLKLWIRNWITRKSRAQRTDYPCELSARLPWHFNRENIVARYPILIFFSEREQQNRIRFFCQLDRVFRDPKRKIKGFAKRQLRNLTNSKILYLYTFCSKSVKNDSNLLQISSYLKRFWKSWLFCFSIVISKTDLGAVIPIFRHCTWWWPK